MSGIINSLKKAAASGSNFQRNAGVPEFSPEMRFSIEPLPGDSGFSQWHSAMKMVSQLPEGIPPEFRRRLWLSLADKHLSSKGIDWPRVERNCFSEWSHPADAELGVQIVKDLHRTGCSLFCGKDGQENQALLKRVLLAYARWNKAVGYCQGFNMLAALILQVTEKCETDALKLMIYLIEGVLPDSYFADSLRGLSVDMAVFRELLRTKLPRLSRHLDTLQVASKEGTTSYEPPLTNVFTMQWFLTLFCNCLPQPTVLRVWDLILLEGNEILLRTALAIWQVLADKIMTAKSADEFYCVMGMLMREILEFDLIDANTLITGIVTIGPLTQLHNLREHYLYNINPWGGTIPAGDSDRRMKVYHKDRLVLDIGVLKKQYTKLKQRQRQAHIIFNTAVARQTSRPTPVAMNHLLLGKSALVPAKRLGPPKGAIPPARQPANIPPPQPPKTLHWKDTSRRDSSSSSTSSSDTELCDEPDGAEPSSDEDDPKCQLPDDNLTEPSDKTLMTEDNTKQTSASASEDLVDLEAKPELDNQIEIKSDIFDNSETSSSDLFDLNALQRSDSIASEDGFDFEKFLEERVKSFKEKTFSSEESIEDTSEQERLRYARRNSVRALEIIQENSLILHRILQCQSRMTPTPPPTEEEDESVPSLELAIPQELIPRDDDDTTPTNEFTANRDEIGQIIRSASLEGIINKYSTISRESISSNESIEEVDYHLEKYRQKLGSPIAEEASLIGSEETKNKESCEKINKHIQKAIENKIHKDIYNQNLEKVIGVDCGLPVTPDACEEKVAAEIIEESIDRKNKVIQDSVLPKEKGPPVDVHKETYNSCKEEVSYAKQNMYTNKEEEDFTKEFFEDFHSKNTFANDGDLEEGNNAVNLHNSMDLNASTREKSIQDTTNTIHIQNLISEETLTQKSTDKIGKFEETMGTPFGDSIMEVNLQNPLAINTSIRGETDDKTVGDTTISFSKLLDGNESTQIIIDNLNFGENAEELTDKNKDKSIADTTKTANVENLMDRDISTLILKDDLYGVGSMKELKGETFGDITEEINVHNLRDKNSLTQGKNKETSDETQKPTTRMLNTDKSNEASFGNVTMTDNLVDRNLVYHDVESTGELGEESKENLHEDITKNVDVTEEKSIEITKDATHLQNFMDVNSPAHVLTDNLLNSCKYKTEDDYQNFKDDRMLQSHFQRSIKLTEKQSQEAKNSEDKSSLITEEEYANFKAKILKQTYHPPKTIHQLEEGQEMSKQDKGNDANKKEDSSCTDDDEKQDKNRDEDKTKNVEEIINSIKRRDINKDFAILQQSVRDLNRSLNYPLNLEPLHLSSNADDSKNEDYLPISDQDDRTIQCASKYDENIEDFYRSSQSETMDRSKLNLDFDDDYDNEVLVDKLESPKSLKDFSECRRPSLPVVEEELEETFAKANDDNTCQLSPRGTYLEESQRDAYFDTKKAKKVDGESGEKIAKEGIDGGESMQKILVKGIDESLMSEDKSGVDVILKTGDESVVRNDGDAKKKEIRGKGNGVIDEEFVVKTTRKGIEDPHQGIEKSLISNENFVIRKGIDVNRESKGRTTNEVIDLTKKTDEEFVVKVAKKEGVDEAQKTVEIYKESTRAYYDYQKHFDIATLKTTEGPVEGKTLACSDEDNNANKDMWNSTSQSSNSGKESESGNIAKCRPSYNFDFLDELCKKQLAKINETASGISKIEETEESKFGERLIKIGDLKEENQGTEFEESAPVKNITMKEDDCEEEMLKLINVLPTERILSEDISERPTQVRLSPTSILEKSLSKYRYEEESLEKLKCEIKSQSAHNLIIERSPFNEEEGSFPVGASSRKDRYPMIPPLEEQYKFRNISPAHPDEFSAQTKLPLESEYSSSLKGRNATRSPFEEESSYKYKPSSSIGDREESPRKYKYLLESESELKEESSFKYNPTPLIERDKLREESPKKYKYSLESGLNLGENELETTRIREDSPPKVLHSGKESSLKFRPLQEESSDKYKLASLSPTKLLSSNAPLLTVRNVTASPLEEEGASETYKRTYRNEYTFESKSPRKVSPISKRRDVTEDEYTSKPFLESPTKHNKVDDVKRSKYKHEETMIEIAKTSKYTSILEYSRNLDERFNNLILKAPGPNLTYSYSLDTDDTPSSSSLLRSPSIEGQASPRSPGRSPSHAYNPFPVNISSRQNKEVAVRLGLYKKS